MRFKIVFLFLVAALSACSFQVDVIETPTPQIMQPSLTPSVTPTSVASTDLSATPPLTSTPTPLPPPPPETAAPDSRIIPIVFAPNGTSQILVGSIPAGTSQVFSLKAMQGQIMAISLWTEDPNAQNTFGLEIKGADGLVLCPMEPYPCPFWRGVLPSTQEYFIRVTPGVGGAFKLRVAINPPGKANQYFAYDDPQRRYSFSYSEEFAPINYAGMQAFKFSPEFALQYIESKQYFRTNLLEAYFLIGSSADPQTVATCTEPASIGGLETAPETVTFNGISFAKSQAVSVGAGNIYDQYFYRTVYNGTCFELSSYLHYANIGNFEPGAATEFDREGLLTKIEGIISTIVLR